MRFLVALLLSGSLTLTVAAQDMPLSQILIPEQSWTKMPIPTTALASGPKGELMILQPNGRGRITHQGRDGEEVSSEMVKDGTAVTLDAMGNVYVCRQDAKTVSLWKLGKSSSLSPILRDLKVTDVVFTAEGIAFCAVPEEKAIYRVTADGKKMIVYKGDHAFARLVLWAKDGTLVAAPAVGSHLWAFRIDETGKLTDGDKYYPLRLTSGKPSTSIGTMTMDARGRLYVATGEGVQVFDTTGRFSGAMVMPGNVIPTHVAFGGKDRDQLFVATPKAIFSRTLKAKRVVRAPHK